MCAFGENAKKCAHLVKMRKNVHKCGKNVHKCEKCKLYVRIMFACVHYFRILAKCETVLALDVEKVNLK